ncbi:uncharacterized protein ARMOST_17359 [Armillaria ostoyae]|uniref:Uncharacterized protein n=1 Tax=Armillaria ostoyae TaxID=47428 RepID=A0A284RYS2_ARMOS|nr:uncharacterized protein ARMOST_17359 [Armillaria ostoyae]
MPSTDDTVAGLLIIAQFFSDIAQCDRDRYALFKGRPTSPPKLALGGKLEDTSRLRFVGDGCDDRWHLRGVPAKTAWKLASGLRPQSSVHLENVRPLCTSLCKTDKTLRKKLALSVLSRRAAVLSALGNDRPLRGSASCAKFELMLDTDVNFTGKAPSLNAKRLEVVDCATRTCSGTWDFAELTITNGSEGIISSSDATIPGRGSWCDSWRRISVIHRVGPAVS